MEGVAGYPTTSPQTSATKREMERERTGERERGKKSERERERTYTICRVQSSICRVQGYGLMLID